jgi:hypothetical protein
MRPRRENAREHQKLEHLLSERLGTGETSWQLPCHEAFRAQDNPISLQLLNWGCRDGQARLAEWVHLTAGSGHCRQCSVFPSVLRSHHHSGSELRCTANHCRRLPLALPSPSPPPRVIFGRHLPLFSVNLFSFDLARGNVKVSPALRASLGNAAAPERLVRPILRPPPV